MTPEQEAEALQYDLASLKLHIEKRLENIRIFEKAILDEQNGTVWDQKMIDFLEARANGITN